MGSTTILRGFKVSVATLDAFLVANSLDETMGTPPFHKRHPDEDPISRLLYSKIKTIDSTANKDKFRVLIPSKEGFNKSNTAYVTYAWVAVYTHRELNFDNDLSTEVPTGFEELRMHILSFGDGFDDRDKIPDEGRMGLFVIHACDYRGNYFPQELYERGKAPQYCDQCDAVFDESYNSFAQRQKHRMAVHGSREGTNPLPEL
ncbi:hypothetical protein B0I35DRAFT_472845 [Stachybotrys elegans]|uniref:C2H2-type domain-containing protein n=1 Tax=Stachybotrys elegans TaxID=80388 RepID=A0A8K0T1D8_9HYPO|nr:hypothetical protein B0I35DRAFT_472845 [Stachybotrys elegans]